MKSYSFPTRFNDVFDKWADSYDETVHNNDGEYAEVFINYEDILNRTAEKIEQDNKSVVIDIGSGTGNLSYKASILGYDVIGIEPNKSMRDKALDKYPNIKFLDGNFLELPFEEGKIDSIITSYAFHHLTDEEKIRAAKYFYEILKSNGSVVIADTMYEVIEDKYKIIEEAKANNFLNLVKDLNSEYYTTHSVIAYAFESAGFKVNFERMNKFVWIMQAKK